MIADVEKVLSDGDHRSESASQLLEEAVLKTVRYRPHPIGRLERGWPARAVRSVIIVSGSPS